MTGTGVGHQSTLLGAFEFTFLRMYFLFKNTTLLRLLNQQPTDTGDVFSSEASTPVSSVENRVPFQARIFWTFINRLFC